MFEPSIVWRARVVAVGALVAAAALVCCAIRPATGQPPWGTETDVVCQKLLDEYILRDGRVQGDDLDAAIQLIASRGRHGYWRVVLEHLEESKVNDNAGSRSARLLAILTKMLQVDGRARWLLSHPEERSAWIPSVALSNDVVDTIIARTKEAERSYQFDPLVAAVVASHDPRTKGFLLEVLNFKEADKPRTARGGIPPPSALQLNGDAQLYAAIGLANLGDPVGVAWLVNNPSGELRLRTKALAELTGLPDRPIEEWQTWWKENQGAKKFEPKSAAQL